MSGANNQKVWDEAFTVRSFDVDQDGVLTPVALFCWLLEAAGRHAQALGWGIHELQERGQTWMLSRCRLAIHALPRWGDTVTVRTWPSGLDRLFALRELRLLDAAGRVLSRATSAWLLLQADARRPLRPPPELAKLAADTPGREDELALGTLPELEHPSPAASFRPSALEIDVNGHVTAAGLLRRVLETLPDETLLQHTLGSLAMEFRAEVRLGEELVGEVGPLPEGTLHRLRRVGDGREAVRAMTSWRPR